MTRVVFDAVRGEAIIGTLRVLVAEAGRNGELRVGGEDGTTLRPISFGERTRIAARAAATSHPVEAVAASVLQHATLTVGEGDRLVLEVLALALAGADRPGASFGETALLLARGTGWSLTDIANGQAAEIDSVASTLVRKQDDGWRRFLIGPSPTDELASIREEYGENVLQRVDGTQAAERAGGKQEPELHIPQAELSPDPTPELPSTEAAVPPRHLDTTTLDLNNEPGQRQGRVDQAGTSSEGEGGWPGTAAPLAFRMRLPSHPARTAASPRRMRSDPTTSPAASEVPAGDQPPPSSSPWGPVARGPRTASDAAPIAETSPGQDGVSAGTRGSDTATAATAGRGPLDSLMLTAAQADPGGAITLPRRDWEVPLDSRVARTPPSLPDWVPGVDLLPTTGREPSRLRPDLDELADGLAVFLDDEADLRGLD